MSSRDNTGEVRPLQGFFRGPAIVPGSIYNPEDVAANLGISPNTLAAWVKSGLPVVRLGERTTFILSDDLIAFFRTRTGGSNDQSMGD